MGVVVGEIVGTGVGVAVAYESRVQSDGEFAASDSVVPLRLAVIKSDVYVPGMGATGTVHACGALVGVLVGAVVGGVVGFVVGLFVGCCVGRDVGLMVGVPAGVVGVTGGAVGVVGVVGVGVLRNGEEEPLQAASSDTPAKIAVAIAARVR